MEIRLKNVNHEEVQGIVNRVREEISARGAGISDDEALSLIERAIFSNRILAMCGLEEQRSLIRQIFYTMRKDLGILQPYAEDSDVSEIMVNGKENIFVEKSGKIVRLEGGFARTQDLEEVIRRICAKVHREINERTPIVDARLSDGSRVNAVYKNIAIDGPILTIRKFPEKGFSMEMLIASGTITREAAEFLQKLVRGGYNIFISGGTSSGKTTFLNVLAGFIPAHERVIVIEDAAELQIRGVENLVRMECRNANVQGKGEVDMQQLIKTSLRMRPDRIIVGEVRGKEVMDMIQAMNTGHDGSLSTGHGNSIEGMLRRLESMFLQAAGFPIEAIRAQIAEGIDVIVHLGRLPDKSRRVLEIAEIEGFDGNNFLINPLFKYRLNEGLAASGLPLKNQEKLELRGLVV